MSDIISVEGQYYILASSPFADDRTWVLKDGETFAVYDRFGDILPIGLGEQGIYHEGTRYLSRLEFRLGGRRPLLLSSTVTEDNVLVTADLTNPDFHLDDQTLVPRGTLHLFRSKFFWKGISYEKLKIWNLGLTQVRTTLSFAVDADYADIFEIRGTRRAKRGEKMPAQVSEGSIVLGYRGLDGAERHTRVDFSPKPREVTSDKAVIDLTLDPQGQATWFITIACETGDNGVRPLFYDRAYEEAEDIRQSVRAQSCEVETSNHLFNEWLGRSVSDLYMMVTETPCGRYPYAGVPWFSAPFGRDGMITAFQTLWMSPGIARGVLSFLAQTQAREESPEQDAEPGKILHEMRRGEMANLKEIPFGLYYGSVDSTPLFVLLAHAFYRRTADRGFIETLWPSIELALEWIDRYGDRDGDGFVEYARRTSRGLRQQGWKDSEDSVFHADGRIADGPIALCEVQAYVYAAKRGAAELCEVLGRTAQAAKLRDQAETLRQKFEAAFWCEDLGTYALALDGNKKPCRVKTSNAGHCLFARIADPERARRVCDQLMSHELFSGWGVRTVATSELRYNPMSYHNGSVWPHDNSMIGYGMNLYGFKDPALRILSGLFDASSFVKLRRLPELFCGFARRQGEGPTLYPVACAPQAWASGSLFLLLQACLGLSIRSSEGKIVFLRPALPPAIHELRLRNLRIGKDSVELLLQRHLQDVNVTIVRSEGDLNIEVIR